MQCPDCGYEADEASVFCPQCRFQFRDIIEEPAPYTDTIIDLPERGVIADENILDEVQPAGLQRMFSDRELVQLQVQLITPAVLVVLILSLLTYTVISAVPFVPLTIAGLDFGITGIICLACGLFSGLVFFFLVRRWLKKSRMQ
jgi:hypothetical protein